MSRARAAAHVVHVINTLEVGGGAEHLVQLAARLPARGFRSTVVSGLPGPAAERLRAAGAAVEIAGALGPAAPVALAARIRPLAPDLLHLHGSRSGFLGGLAARAIGLRRVVYTAHMFSFRRRLPPPLPWLAERAERIAGSAAARVICVSESDAADAARRRIAPGRVATVPNGIDLARFPAAADRRGELGLPSGAPVVGLVGRLVPQKDPVAFARMARLLAAQVPEARFVVAGDGPLRPALEAEAADLVARGRLTVLGFRPDVPELLASLDVAAFPALWEAQGIALIEAMAAGRAAVATRIPAHVEALDDGAAGALVPQGDPRAMAAAIAALLADPAQRAALGSRARRRAVDRYGIEAMIEATAALYREVIETAG